MARDPSHKREDDPEILIVLHPDTGVECHYEVVKEPGHDWIPIGEAQDEKGIWYDLWYIEEDE